MITLFDGLTNESDANVVVLQLSDDEVSQAETDLTNGEFIAPGYEGRPLTNSEVAWLKHLGKNLLMLILPML